MSKAPIIEKLLQLNEKSMTSFHVPGHKNGKIYDRIPYKNYKDILYKLDTTEIPGTDNLHKAREIIKESQERAGRIFNSEETFFLVNGSTSGIYSMIMASTSPGDKILIDRNCHQSVINATILGDLEPLYVYPEIDEKEGIAMGMVVENIERQLKKHGDIKAVVVTYPTYYGIAYDLKEIREVVDKYDKILLVDEAHGAHLGLSQDLPPTALSCGADGAVQSTHKTLPSFTQSSMLHVQGGKIDRDKLKFMLKIHQSSSPSYLLLSSLDFAVTVYEKKGKDLMNQLLKNIGDFKEEAGKIDGISIMGQEVIGSKGVKALDLTRIWIKHKNITGYELDKILRQDFNIQMELSNSHGVLGVTSIANDKEDLNRLLDALNEISKYKHRPQTKHLQGLIFENMDQVITPKEALYRPKQRVLLEESQGYISGEYVIPYPPGIPLVTPGEKINDRAIEEIRSIVDNGGEILGLKDSNCRWIETVIY